MACADTLRVGYILGEYPCLTETFVTNEIRALVQRGAAVTVFALRRGDGAAVPGAQVRYRDALPRRLSPRARADLLSAAWEALRLEASSPAVLPYALRNVRAAVGFACLAREEAIQHLHAHFAHIPTDVALMMGSALPVSVSFSAHARDVYCGARGLAPKLARAALCITCTDAARQRVTGLVRRQDRPKILRIYHGTDLERFRFRPRPAVSSPARILAVGRLVPKKGFETLLRACRRLRSVTSVHCEIIGPGPLRTSLLSLAEKMGIGDIVEFRGALPHRSLPEAYGRADVLAVPSVVAPDGDRDGLPNVVIEAMASGLPVVGSRLSGIPEAVEDGRTGLLCTPGDDGELCQAIHRLLLDSELRRRCVEAGRALVEERFDAARNSAKVLEAFLSVAGR